MPDQIQNTIEIRSFNKKKIIDYIRLNSPVTKKDISNTLGLSFATVSNLSNQLIEEGILQIASLQNSSGGRMSGLLTLNLSSKYMLGINIVDMNSIEIALLNLKNEKLASKCFPIQEIGEFDRLTEMYFKYALGIVEEYGVSYKDILGAGIAVPGILNRDTGKIQNSTNPVFENKPLIESIQKVLRLPVYMENESNLLVLATSLYQREKYRLKDLVYLYIGEGLGVGIICNGSLVAGKKGLGGEISHLTLGYRNYECYCGHEGCVETEISIYGFLRKYAQEVDKDIPHTHQEWDDFVSKVLGEDCHALNVVRENGQLIGRLVAVLANIFAPEAIYIGGATESIFDLIYPHIINEFKNRLIIDELKNTPIINGVNYHDLLFKGCGELVFTNWNP